MSKIKRIKYFSYYGCNDIGRQRYNSPAADTKNDYIASVFNRCGYAFDTISIGVHFLVLYKTMANYLRLYKQKESKRMNIQQTVTPFRLRTISRTAR